MDEPAVTFSVEPETSLEIYPLAPGEKVADPHENRTWPGPGIAVVIRSSETTEIRYFSVSEEGFWRLIRQAFNLAEAILSAEERRDLLELLGDGISPE